VKVLPYSLTDEKRLDNLHKVVCDYKKFAADPLCTQCYLGFVHNYHFGSLLMERKKRKIEESVEILHRPPFAFLLLCKLRCIYANYVSNKRRFGVDYRSTKHGIHVGSKSNVRVIFFKSFEYFFPTRNFRRGMHVGSCDLKT